MSVVLLVVGILLAASGGVAVGFGIPISTLSLGATLILAGTVTAVGGLLLIGLSAVTAELAQVRKALRTAPAVRPARSAEAAAVAVGAALEAPPASPPRIEEPRLAEAQVPAAAEAAAVDVSASAIERLRSTIPRPERVVPESEGVPLSPNGGHSASQPERPGDRGAQPAAGATTQTLREPRFDGLPRPRVPRSAPAESFDAVWPKRAREASPSRGQEAAVALEPATADPAPAMNNPPAEAVATRSSSDGLRPATVLKSGVVDGMAYTLYADGSIEAQLPQGTVRFGSIAELRAHIESNS
jgi:hypothetical protein